MHRGPKNFTRYNIFVCLGQLRCGAAYVFCDGFRVRGPGTIDVYSDQPRGQVIGAEPGRRRAKVALTPGWSVDSRLVC
jgi:hypothetical protein